MNEYTRYWQEIAAQLLLSAMCLCLTGCATPWYTREECLAIVKSRGFDVELLEPRNSAEKVRNPMVLVGTWSGETDMTMLFVQPGMNDPGMNGLERQTRLTSVYDFRADGTYTHVSGFPEDNDLTKMILDKNRVFGTWKIEGDVLELRETCLYDGKIIYRNLESRKNVFWFGYDEIEFQFASRRDMQNASVEGASQRRSNSQYTAMFRGPLIDVGYDRQNREVYCTFIPHKDDKGDMIVTVYSNSRYVRMSRPSMQLATVAVANTPTTSHSSLVGITSSRPTSQDGAPKYVIERFSWVGDGHLRCGFEYKIVGECTLRLLSEIERDVCAYIRNSYLSSHLMLDAQSVVVDARVSFVGGRVVGTGEVLTIDGKLSYDATTRRGMVSVRFGVGQYEEVRKWVRRNIETLVQDKNILLVTGEIPPPGHYISGDERVVDTKGGKMLEMEFMTE